MFHNKVVTVRPNVSFNIAGVLVLADSCSSRIWKNILNQVSKMVSGCKWKVMMNQKIITSALVSFFWNGACLSARKYAIFFCLSFPWIYYSFVIVVTEVFFDVILSAVTAPVTAPESSSTSQTKKYTFVIINFSHRVTIFPFRFKRHTITKRPYKLTVFFLLTLFFAFFISSNYSTAMIL